MRLLPEISGNLEWIDPSIFPPCDFIAGPMQLAVMAATERHCEFVADFEADGPWLSKPQVMRVGWLPPANHTRLCCHEFQMHPVPQPFWLSDDELAFVDATGVWAGFAGDERRCTLPTQLFRYRWMLSPAVES